MTKEQLCTLRWSFPTWLWRLLWLPLKLYLPFCQEDSAPLAHCKASLKGRNLQFHVCQEPLYSFFPHFVWVHYNCMYLWEGFHVLLTFLGVIWIPKWFACHFPVICYDWSTQNTCQFNQRGKEEFTVPLPQFGAIVHAWEFTPWLSASCWDSGIFMYGQRIPTC